MSPFHAHCSVCAVHRKGARDALRVVIHATVVDERTNRHQLRQFGDATDVVTVKVRDEQVVNPRDTRQSRDLEDPLWVARLGGIAGPRSERAGAREPGVDEQRLPSGARLQRR